jgi:hypothetical protein
MGMEVAHRRFVHICEVRSRKGKKNRNEAAILRNRERAKKAVKGHKKGLEARVTEQHGERERDQRDE